MGIIMIVIGVAVVFLGYTVAKKQKAMEATCTAQTTGKVVDLEQRKHTSEEGGRETTTVMYAPVFAYSVNGMEIKRAAAVASAHPKLKLDQQITVFYNPSDPQKYYVAEDRASQNSGKLFMMIGAIFAVAGVVVCFIA